jgi:pimeloyl-ACP methyl ester carboxylesterase
VWRHALSDGRCSCDDRPAHLAGIGVGGMVAQVAALDHPDAFSALTSSERGPSLQAGRRRPS